MSTPSAPQPVIKRYYPTLSSVVTLDDFPESLGFLKQAIESLFSKIHYKDLQYKKSPKGDAAFYSLSIVSNKLAIELFGSGISLVLNPDETNNGDFNISAFPVTVEYQWKILAYLRSFDLNNFSFTPQEFFELGLIILNISEEQALAQFINTFTVPIDEDTLALEQFVNDLKEYNNDPVIQTLNLTINEDSKLTDIVQAINTHTGKYATLYAFGAYLLNNDLNETKKKLEAFFRAFIPTDIESYIKDILIPKVRATLTVSAAIEFPRSILYPYQDTDGNGIWEREPENSNVLTRFYFGKILLYADTEAGVGYKMDLVGDLRPTYSEIGKTGLLFQLEKLKLDLSDKVNIPEADADGRPVDFRGVYADALSVTLPAKWFKSGTNTNGSTLRIGGYNLLIGTGGVSGTFALEAVPTQNPSDGQIIDFFSDKFEFVYPIKGIKNNVTTNNEEVIEINNEVELLSYLNSLTNKSLYNFKFPLEVSSSGTIKEFNSSQEFRNFITSFIISENGTMWANVGGDNGFLVGFQKFDITFKQNKVISSNIKGKLEIKKFVYPQGALDDSGQEISYPTTVNIGINGHLSDDGDFNLTASAQPPYPIEFPEVFTYRMKSVELGKEDDDFYIGTSGTLQFEGFLKETLNLGPVEIERLRIYSDGSIEFKGGSVQLIEPIVLPLGPVNITVSAIHYGSHQKEVDGVMRKFNYFGFDGGVSIDPLGVEVRGDGVKYYYCSDNLPNKPKPYLHIQTLYLDLVLPANKGTLAEINGWVTIPEPGISKEYAGEIALKIPRAKLAGKAGIKLMPKYPAFIIDCELEPSVPISLGSFAIYGFRGLLGYRYVAEKQAIGLTQDNTWYEYYKAPKLGINVQKFSGPDKSVNYNTLISLGAGATLGTSADQGYTFSLKAMALFSIPSLFMIDGRANILTKRLGLNDTQDPPFFAFVTVGDDCLELGFGADYKLPASGYILAVYAEIQAGFFFKNQKPWYINVGTNINPVSSRILNLINLKSYVMLSASGMKAGARGEFNFDRNYGVIKVKAHAFIEIGGRVSFERPQIGAYLMAGVSAYIKVLFVSLNLDVGILFGVEAPRPFIIYGKFYFRIKVGIKIFGKRITLFKFSGNLEVVWNINKNIDRKAINPINTSIPLISPANSEQFSALLQELVQGVNMLTNETFTLGFLDAKPSDGTLPLKIEEYVIPLDTYIDIKTQKGLLPGNAQDPNNSVRKLIGGINNAPANYVDLIPPVSTIRGRSIHQVKHQYTIEHLEIKFWNKTKNKWEAYHPYEALYPTDPSVTNLKVGQFQKRDGVYNALRILATTPFSYTEQGQSGWYVPEQYGINASTLFCEAEQKEHQCADFLLKPLQAKYYCGNPNTPLFSNEAAFKLLTENQDDFAFISNKTNSFNIEKSLAFDNWNSMEIILPEPSVMTALKLSNQTSGAKVKFYSIIQNPQNDVQFNVVYGNPNPSAFNQNEPFEMVLSATELQQEIRYNFTLNNGEWQAIAPHWRAVKRIVIEPIFDPLVSQQITMLNEQIAEIKFDNELISAGVIDGEILSTSNLEQQLQELMCPEEIEGGCPDQDLLICDLYHQILAHFEAYYIDPDLADENFFISGKDDIIINLIRDFDGIHPNYNLLGETGTISIPYEIIVSYFSEAFVYSYTDLFNAVLQILNYLAEIGNCDCKCERKELTLIHQVCWMTLEDYEYNINIPSQAAIQADAQATIDGLTKYIQPIWRPDTNYYIHFVLKDNVDNGNVPGQSYPFTYGFSTAGPLGFFHTHEKATYGDIQLKPLDKLLKLEDDTFFIVDTNGLKNEDASIYIANTNGFILEDTTGILKDAVTKNPIMVPGSNPERKLKVTAHPDKYPLTSLKQYIDYNRSYPNADGNLLSAKPLFYDDRGNHPTQIQLFFSKAYATHFFQKWEDYKNAPSNHNTIDGRLKIVIKEPVEDISFDNPPSLNYDASITNIPQTELTWSLEENPQIPFAINQYLSMYNASQCVGSVTVIKPASEYVTIYPKHLKPNKLYTAIVNNLYDVNNDGAFGNTATVEETREVHKFVFKTSRYKDFEAQITSYTLEQNIDGNTVSRKALFKFEKQFESNEINGAYTTIVNWNNEETNQIPLTGFSAEVLDNLNNNYQHPYDRIFEGIFGLKPWDEPISTEVNVLKDLNTGNRIALIVRNPEPFNNPKFRKEVIVDTIQVFKNGMIDNSFKVLFSKDNSQAILMNATMNITENLELKFKYKVYKDFLPGDDAVINYPVMKEVVLSVDLLNN